MKISREKLIRFYDEKLKVEGRGSDVSALTGLWGEDLLVGVLQLYWKNVEKADSKILSYACSCGTKSGYRLDAWLLKGNTLYQVEVKNWAAYSLGERELKFDATQEKIEKYCKEQWDYYFKSDEIPVAQVAKVFTPMKKPEGYETCQVTPLLCFWFFICESIQKPYSTRPYANGKKLDVFSASAYLRSLKDEKIEIAMPRAERRLRLLSELILTD